MTTLYDLLTSLATLDDEMTICAKKVGEKWTPHSEAWLVKQDVESDDPAPSGYFLEVSIAKEVLDGWTKYQLKRQPTKDEIVTRIIYYATNDA